jgi:hypothetical protein
MSFTVELKGQEELVAEMMRIERDWENGIEKEVNKAGLILTTSIKKRYQAIESRGVSYVRGGETAYRSKPGNPPNTDEGTLVKSVTFKRTGAASVEVFTLIPYGAMLEWGTHKMAARPLWRPEAEKMQKMFNGAIKAVIEKGARKANR